MIAEAIDAAVTVGWALLAWIVLTAAFATAALYVVVAAVWAVVRFIWLTLSAGWAAAASGRPPVGPSWRRGRIRARIYAARPVRGSGGLLRLPARGVLGAPLLHRRLRPHGGAPDLLGPREVGDPVDEVVDALPVDAEACRDSAAEVLGQDPLRLVRPSDLPYCLAEFDGYDGSLRLVPASQEDALPQQSDGGDHVGDVGARL